MNEGFSDIWGACIEFSAAPTKSMVIGEDIERRTGHLSLRSMSNPNAEGQPDTTKELLVCRNCRFRWSTYQ
jgi:Zn-dependent metalloprotease